MILIARAARRGLVLVFAALVIAALGLPAWAAPPPSTIGFLASLSDAEIEEFRVWKAARGTYEQALDTYWDAIESKRHQRRRKRNSKLDFNANDYVMTLPPSYEGPSLSAQLGKKYSAFLAAQREAAPNPPKELATIADYLAAAKRVYGFTPERVSEREFKQRYAAEAAALGLSKEQVVRIYALETGGVGTYDMQAGVHPRSKTGRAISSALGYAQLLDANSINEVSRSGAKFIERLKKKARDPSNSAERTAELQQKISVLRKMYANCKRVPFEWSEHQAYAKTPAGMGVHALNIDGDLGPMLQATKLRTLKDIAEKYGRSNLSGAEMELMNLAGPVTGLEMLAPAGANAPTANFFSRRAYYVNKMVIGLTGAGLQAELDRRMQRAITTPGSTEFADAFDSVHRQRAAGR